MIDDVAIKFVIVMAVALGAVALMVWDADRHPIKFCRQCGHALTVEPLVYAYHESTGEPIVEDTVVCPVHGRRYRMNPQ